MAFFLLYCSPYGYCSSNYCDSNCCRSFSILKAIAKSKTNLLLSPLRARKSANYCYRNSWKSNNYRKGNIINFAKSYEFQKEYFITLLRIDTTILILIAGDDFLRLSTLNADPWSLLLTI